MEGTKMYLVVRDEHNNIKQVYGYISVSNVSKYTKDKFPNDNLRWELSIPFEYTGEVIYLPEKNNV